MRILRQVIAAVTADEGTLAIIERQQRVIRLLKEARERDQLEYVRNLRDLIVRFRDALDYPDQEEVELGLDAAIADLSDHIARAEEHVV